MAIRIGIDVGGTFTDVTGFDEDKREVCLIRKYSSNPADPMAVMQVITDDLLRDYGPDGVNMILHGSTAALNCMLEDKGVKVGLITTDGFRDVYEIGRQWRGDDVFNLLAPAPKMLTTRDLIHEARGRLDYRGEEVTPLNREDVAAATRALVAAGVEAIAVCFLFSYTNPAQEREAAEIIRAIAPGMYVSLSCEVNPEWREYERTASTVANAYIGPPVSRYLHGLETLVRSRFPACRTLMMKSDGGAASAAMLSRAPVQTVMSGPVAGVIGSRFLGDQKGIDNLITFDTGGTSSDMAVIPGKPQYKTEVSVGRHPLRTQTVDIDTIGAGGGSIASVELGGVLKVGPQSAGARPGPACYDRGGVEPTLTDALVVLGHLSSRALLEGSMALAANKAHKAVSSRVAEPLAMSEADAAWGVLTVLATNCVTAMRTITVERGYDPREFTLVPFGGMGPTISGMIAGELGIRRILVPPNPGAFSAWGMLVTDVHQERSLTRVTALDDAAPETIEAVFRGMEEEAIRDLAAENFPRDRLKTLRAAGMRYRGQSYEVNVDVPTIAGREDLALLAERFHDAHLRRYGHKATSEVVEIVNYKVTGVGIIPKPELKALPETGGALPKPLEVRQAFFGAAGTCETPVYRRADLLPGVSFAGPAIVEEQTSTIVLYPGQQARVDGHLNIEIDLGERA
jgi:N-methylhydantoinase A